MTTVELWGGPHDGERHQVADPAPREYHVPITKPVKFNQPPIPSTEPIGYDVLRYIFTGCKTKDGKAIIYRYEKPKAKE